MTFALNRGVSFCRVDNRFVVLDLVGDRYFCLEGAAEDAFRRLTDGTSAPPGSRADGERLVALGIVRHCAEAKSITPCLAPPTAASQVVPLGVRITLGNCIAASARLVAAKITLKLFGLDAVIAPLVRIKRRQRRASEARHHLQSIITQFQNLDRWVTPLDQCVPRSVAIMRCCLAAHIDATLVIGVKLRPFAAHCWVQHGDMLLAEQLDTVRLYTPILVV
ncbi:lasso peptide biosynthesis B2 protein [Sphingomonas koreensis]|nr:lasso peptide biosynthesis B2 protein [Sphingomonas koreensis]